MSHLQSTHLLSMSANMARQHTKLLQGRTMQEGIVRPAGSQMDADLDTSTHKSQSQGALDDGGVIIQETEAYKVVQPHVSFISQSISSDTPVSEPLMVVLGG